MKPGHSDIQERDSPDADQGLCVWSSNQLVEYAVGVLDRLKAPVNSVGGPDVTEARFHGLGNDVVFFDDLRAGPAESQAQAVLLADRRFDPTMSIRGEPRLCTLEPLERPTSINQSVVQIGSFIRSAGFKAALQILDDFGPITSLHITSHCADGQGSLYSRLYDAVTTVLSILGGPDMIDAMLVPPVHTSALEAPRAQSEQLPEGLSQLTGDLGALIRCQPRGLVTISASDQACWERSVRVLGPAGTVGIDQVGISWTAPSGKVIEDQPRERGGFETACRQAAEEIDQWLAGQLDTSRETDTGLAIATCEATRLSCRTREPESTEKVRELLTRT